VKPNKKKTKWILVSGMPFTLLALFTISKKASKNSPRFFGFPRGKPLLALFKNQ